MFAASTFFVTFEIASWLRRPLIRSKRAWVEALATPASIGSGSALVLAATVALVLGAAGRFLFLYWFLLFTSVSIFTLAAPDIELVYVHDSGPEYFDPERLAGWGP